MPQVRKRGETGAKIIERVGDAQFMQSIEFGNDEFHVGHQHAFSQFEDQPLWVSAGFVQSLTHQFLEVIVHKLAGADIDRQGHVSQIGMLAPFGQGETAFFEHPATDGDHQAKFFRLRNELDRGDNTPFRAVPAQQRFSADCALGQIDLWLIDEVKLIVPQGGHEIVA